MSAKLCLVITLGLTLLATSCGQSSSGSSSINPNDLPTVVFSGTTPNAANWAIQVGIASGLFNKYGTNTKLIFSATSPAAIAAMIGGSVNFTSATLDSGILAHASDPEVEYVGGFYNTMPYDMVVQKDVTDVTQIKGKTCGAINPPNLGDALVGEKMIKIMSNGTMSYPKDYKLATLPVGGTAGLAALKSNAIQCFFALPPSSNYAAANGYKILQSADKLPEFKTYILGGINSTKPYMSKNKDVARKFLMGYIAAIHYLYDPANKTKVIQTLADNAGLAPDLASAAYAVVEKHGYPCDGLMPTDGIKGTLDVQHEFGQMANITADPTSDMLDQTLVKEAYKQLPDSLKTGCTSIGFSG